MMSYGQTHKLGRKVKSSMNDQLGRKMMMIGKLGRKEGRRRMSKDAGSDEGERHEREKREDGAHHGHSNGKKDHGLEKK